eukprot:TRINITY_DN3517_c0_g1_i2.p4 TRINITY_DN3517_c0_g1~~TRINITY_DN3517_c0_g1_i2.p4  ORF type:complete len:494 (+),score=125.67 TRINITY_DN3517_c0_g1_i2:2165-3646(+)
MTNGASTKSRDLRQTATSNEGERRCSEEVCAITRSNSQVHADKAEGKIKDNDGDEDSTEQLLKTPQLCMPDISDFAELMADIEKQALSSVGPNMALSYEMATGQLGNDKENKESETRKQKRVQLAVDHGARKDSADLKPPVQRSRAASFKGRPPRRSLMPQNVASNAANSGEDEIGDNRKAAKVAQKARETTTTKMMQRKGSTRAVGGATSGQQRVTSSRAVSTRNASAVGSGIASSGRGTSKNAASERRKRGALAPRVQQVADALRSCRAAAKEGWERKTHALTTLQERTRALGDDKLPARLAEDCAVTLCELLFDGHNKVSLAALESLFFLLLCSEGSAQTKALQRALQRRGDALRRVLALTRESREDRRLASERVLDAFCVQFAPETQVALTLNAMTADVVRSVDARVATGGCGVLTRAFERAERNEGGFVWRGAVLELLISTLARLATDRRLGVRRASKTVAAAAARCLPERAFDMACRKVRVRSALFK